MVQDCHVQRILIRSHSKFFTPAAASGSRKAHYLWCGLLFLAFNRNKFLLFRLFLLGFLRESNGQDAVVIFRMNVLMLQIL